MCACVFSANVSLMYLFAKVISVRSMSMSGYCSDSSLFMLGVLFGMLFFLV